MAASVTEMAKATPGSELAKFRKQYYTCVSI